MTLASTSSFNTSYKYHQWIPGVGCHSALLDLTLGSSVWARVTAPPQPPLVGSPTALRPHVRGDWTCPAQVMISLQSPSDSLREAEYLQRAVARQA